MLPKADGSWLTVYGLDAYSRGVYLANGQWLMVHGLDANSEGFYLACGRA